MDKNLIGIAVGVAMISATAFAQEDYTNYKSDVTVQALGSVVKSTTQGGIEQDATNSGGVLATYRFWFDRHNGVEANYAWTANTEMYNQLGVDNNSHEISAAYVAQLDGLGRCIDCPPGSSGASPCLQVSRPPVCCAREEDSRRIRAPTWKLNGELSPNALHGNHVFSEHPNRRKNCLCFAVGVDAAEDVDFRTRHPPSLTPTIAPPHVN